MKARSKSTGSRDHGITPRESVRSVTHRAGRLLKFLWVWCWSEISLSSCFLSTSNVQHTETESHKYFYTHSEKHSRAGTHIPDEPNYQYYNQYCKNTFCLLLKCPCSGALHYFSCP